MYFNKVHHPNNFTFAGSLTDGRLDFGFAQAQVHITDHGEDCFHLSLEGERWGPRRGLNALTPPTGESPSSRRIQLGDDGSLSVLGADGETLLGPGPSGSIALSGCRWLVEFGYSAAFTFYGLGEKTGYLEKSGKRTKFWNTDVWADFPWEQIRDGRTDPMYVSIPYTALRTGRGWVGLLIDNPYASFLSTGGSVGAIANQQDINSNKRFYLGAEQGAPSLWVIVADSLAELTERYQRLVGPTPMPPLWALGHHQCRWGYSSVEDLHWVKKGMADAGIPNSGLWLDIEYMDGYRVFTWNDREEGWTDLPSQLAELQADGQRVVPILDPGVKKDPGYAAYESGFEADIWCKNEDGLPFVGYVWPGETLFPDYMTDSGRKWWADQVELFASAGIHGAWCDMNDPAVGPVELDPMRFEGGSLEHEAGHNQYGAQMARATRAGIQAAHADERPFVLGRSGYTGCQQHTALWTGDNLSNWTYLKGAIPCTLNLALSGVPLNGPDVPGFGEDAGEELALRWYQTGFLFPFLRNHCTKGNRGQEPFTFSRPTRTAISHLIRLRYRLLPYLYQLWIAHEERGSAVLRPLIHDFDEERFLGCGDAFLVGPALLQAPFFWAGGSERHLDLPSGWWFDLRSGAWCEAGHQHIQLADQAHTPLYARSGQVIPMQRQTPSDHRVDLSEVDLHCFLRPGEFCEVVYHADDGETWAYRRGERSTWRGRISADENNLMVETISCATGWKPISIRIVSYGGQDSINGQATEAFAWTATGIELGGRLGVL